MKHIYIKLFTVIALSFSLKNNANAQNWMVGDAVNDTIKYLTLVAWEFDTTFDATCYEMGMPDHNFYMQPCEDPGIDYGFVVEEITNSGAIEITPSGFINLGDTVWLTDEDVLREIFFEEMGGYVKLRFFAVGEVTVPNVEVYCSPGNDLWFSNLLLCNEGLWTNPTCVTVPNPLSVQDLKVENINISYPSNLNAYKLSFDTDEKISMIAIFDIQGKQVSKSSSNSIDCSYLEDGVYLVSVLFESGKLVGEKFVLNK